MGDPTLELLGGCLPGSPPGGRIELAALLVGRLEAMQHLAGRRIACRLGSELPARAAVVGATGILLMAAASNRRMQGQVLVVHIEPDAYLRSLSGDLLARHRRRPEGTAREQLLADSSTLQAVANAFVVLDLMDEPSAESVLAEHRSELEQSGVELRGVSTGELTLLPGNAHGIGERRQPNDTELGDQPLAVAVPWCTLGDFMLYSLVRTPTGVWIRAAAHGQELPSGGRELLSELSLSDERGNRYELRRVSAATTTGPSGYHVDLVATTHAPLLGASLEITAPHVSTPLRVEFPPPPTLPSGRSEKPTTTPAERYLSRLTPGWLDPSAKVGVGLDGNQALKLVATVADALLVVGALPPDSPVLAALPRDPAEPWVEQLVHRWVTRVRQQLRPGPPPATAAPGVHLPFEKAVVAIELLGILDGVVTLQVFAAPQHRGEYWPVAVADFEVRAVDDAGIEHRLVGAIGSRSLGLPLGAPLWPPIGDSVRTLRVEVSSLWESAWVEIPVPGR
ncbi:MAG: hypothetical protein M0Z46_03890 [Actinomycetota bacterium]|nr:hypothetical protein [Actinomycetota bacterium]MDA8314033.1 hypothetical protein [Actinomycetota bacterium]